MVDLNPTQFKIDLGDRVNRTHDHMESVKSQPGHFRPPVSQADPGYYAQPSSMHRQLALPGMEMSVQDHLDALGRATGTRASIDSGKISHRLMLHDVSEPGTSAYGGIERSHLSYDNKRRTWPMRDSGNEFEPQYHPGEIRMIKSGKPGDASAMLSTAESLAREHGFPFPKHSHERTSEGLPWSRKQMAKRGERVW